ncbi:MAG: hypothetical protein QOG04_689 [Actinomycetota bacterium]|jgi:hypothetical protein|nr:hypothetical protein [Actinomycetota bacterium]
MMNRKTIIGAVVGLLLLTGIIGANLVMAGGQTPAGTVKSQEATTEDDNLDCPAQGLPACQGQMNDEKSEGSENAADDKNEANEGPENEADDKNEKNEGAENAADDRNEVEDGQGQND